MAVLLRGNDQWGRRVPLCSSSIPIALALFGLGMTAGNLIGGRLADIYPARGLVMGFGSALIVLAALAAGGGHVWILMPALVRRRHDDDGRHPHDSGAPDGLRSLEGAHADGRHEPSRRSPSPTPSAPGQAA